MIYFAEPPDGTIVLIHRLDLRRNPLPLITVRDEERARAARASGDIPSDWDGAWWRVGHDLPHAWPAGPHDNVVRIDVLGVVSTLDPVDGAQP